LFRTRYEGKTLRDNLGLARPVNPWSQPAWDQQAPLARTA